MQRLLGSSACLRPPRLVRAYAVVQNEKQVAQRRAREQARVSERKTARQKVVALQREADAYRLSPLTMDVSRAMQYFRAFHVGRAAHSTTICLNVRVIAEQGQQKISGSLRLPRPLSESKIWVLTSESAQAQAAVEAGATRVGSEDILQLIRDGKDLDADTLIATPEMLSRIMPFARFLGPKGLMPSPRRGTVVAEVREAVLNAKALVNYKQQDDIVALPVSQASFSDAETVDNILHAVTKIKEALPKGTLGRTLLTSERCANISILV